MFPHYHVLLCLDRIWVTNYNRQPITLVKTSSEIWHFMEHFAIKMNKIILIGNINYLYIHFFFFSLHPSEFLNSNIKSISQNTNYFEETIKVIGTVRKMAVVAFDGSGPHFVTCQFVMVVSDHCEQKNGWRPNLTHVQVCTFSIQTDYRYKIIGLRWHW